MAADDDPFRALFDHANDAVALVEYRGEMPVIVNANPEFRRTFAPDESDLAGRPLDDVVASGDRKPEAEAISRRVKGGDLVSRELTRETVEGSREFDWQVVPVAAPEDQSYERAFAIYSDITERKRREAERRRIRDQTTFAFEETNTTVWTWNPDAGKSTTLYRSLEELLGMDETLEEGVEEFLEAVVHPEDRAAVARAYEEVVRGDSDRLTIEFRKQSDEGPYRWFRADGYLRSDRDPPTLIGLMTEITDQKRRAQEIERQKERLEAFTRVVSHDLRNPLNVATGRVRLAQGADNGGAHLEIAERALERMSTLIRDLLTLAGEGRSIGTREPVELRDVLDQCWTAVETGECRLEVETDRSVRADRSRLRQLLENVLRNAVEHGGEETVITADDLETGFYLEDDGPGIPPGDRERVFTVGFSTSTEGTGFGLGIVREIAAAHDWRVDVTEGADGGARFEFTDVDLV